jgi:5-methylthioadenosine/S-adenosylhomocysteine deaminase
MKDQKLCRILIKNASVITVDNQNRIIKDGAIFIENDLIADIGKTDHLSPKYSSKSDKVIDAKQNIVIPGLINTHTHTVFYLTRGLAMDNYTRDWLRGCIFPFQAHMTEQDGYIGALLGCIENLKTGTTFIIDNNTNQRKDRKGITDSIAQATEKSGIRSIVLRGYIDMDFMIPEIFVESLDSIVHDYRHLIEKWHNKGNGRIMIWIHPANLLYCSSESLCKSNDLAKEYNIGIHTHVAEDREGMKFINERYNGKGYVDVFHDLDVLGSKFQMAHTIFVSEKEIQYIAESNARVMYTPTADMLLAAGAAPIEEMRKKGIVVGLGTDSPNNSQDMIQCMKFGALLQKGDAESSKAMPAEDILRIATIEGAKAIGMENQIGSLEVGKKADIVIVDIHKPHTTPFLDPVSTLIYSSSGQDVDTVLVDGEILVEGGKLTKIDESDVLIRAQEASERLIKQFDFKIRGNFV